mgnify:CR=1 FL=1
MLSTTAIAIATSRSLLLRNSSRGISTSASAANPSKPGPSSLRPMPLHKLAAPVQAHRITSAQSLSSLVRAATGNSGKSSAHRGSSSSSITTMSNAAPSPAASTRKVSLLPRQAPQFKAPRFSTRAREDGHAHTASAKARSPGALQATRFASVTIIALALANELQA